MVWRHQNKLCAGTHLGRKLTASLSARLQHKLCHVFGAWSSSYVGQHPCFVFSLMANPSLLKGRAGRNPWWGCLHREHQMRSSANAGSPWERRAQKWWLPKVVLPHAFPTGNFPLLHCSHRIYCVASKSDWQGAYTAPLWLPEDTLVAQHLFHMVGGSREVEFLSITMKNTKSRSVMCEAL